MGLLLLFLRVGTIESGFFKGVHASSEIRMGDLGLIFINKENLYKYIHCICIGIPIWFVVGLLIMNSKDNFGPWLGVEIVSNGLAVMYCYIGLSVGDLVSGVISQFFRSRKLVVYLYLGFTLVISIVFLFVLKEDGK